MIKGLHHAAYRCRDSEETGRLHPGERARRARPPRAGRLTAPDPELRYASAEAAETGPEGLAQFQRTLVMGDLASEYENELRVWLEELD